MRPTHVADPEEALDIMDELWSLYWEMPLALTPHDQALYDRFTASANGAEVTLSPAELGKCARFALKREERGLIIAVADRAGAAALAQDRDFASWVAVARARLAEPYPTKSSMP